MLAIDAPAASLASAGGAPCDGGGSRAFVAGWAPACTMAKAEGRRQERQASLVRWIALACAVAGGGGGNQAMFCVRPWAGMVRGLCVCVLFWVQCSVRGETRGRAIINDNAQRQRHHRRRLANFQDLACRTHSLHCPPLSHTSTPSPSSQAG